MLGLSLGLGLGRTSGGRDVLFRYEAGSSLAAATFLRGSTAMRRDADGKLRSAAVNELRISYELNPVTGLYEPTALLEGSGTNRLYGARNIDNWNTRAGTTLMRARTDGADGTNNATRLTGLGASGANDVYRPDSGHAASSRVEPSVYLRVPAATPHTLTLSNPQGGPSGSWTLDLSTLTPGVWTWITRSHPGVTIANEFVATAGGAAGLWLSCSTGTITLDVDFAQVEDGTFASSPIPTTAAAVTRSADNYSAPFPHPPQEMTVYVRFIERGTIQLTGYQRVVQIGNGSNPADREFNIRADAGTQKYGAIHEQADGTAGSGGAVPSAAPALGDLVELRAILFSDGSVQIGQATNLGAEGLSVRSAAKALSAAWATPQLVVNTGFNAFQRVVVAKGVRTLAEMRAL